MMDIRSLRRRLLAPEVVQTSEMDCGPASLKCMLEGFGIAISYGRLREACQTDVDGASIDTLEEVAVQLGLDAVQIMLPPDHLLLTEAQALPAIVVVRLPNGFTHFVVVWRAGGGFVQMMDPATGRRWTTAANFLATLYEHALPVPAAAWREWAGSAEFLDPLRRRLIDLRIPRPQINRQIETALAHTSWRSLAALDAATRQSAAMVQAGGIRRGREAVRLLDAILTQADTVSATDTIPTVYWSVQPGPPADDGEEQVMLHGAVLVRVRGRQPATPEGATVQSLSPELAAALAETPARPGKEVLRLLGAAGLRAAAWLGPAVLLSAAAIVVEAVLLRRLIDIGQILDQTSQRIICPVCEQLGVLDVVAMILLFALGLLLLRYAVSALTFRLGRQLELRLRRAVYQKIPRLRDPYLHSRPISDMAQRSHLVQRLCQLPHLAVNLVQTGFALLFTTIGIIWLSPVNRFTAPLAALSALAWPVLMLPWLSERDLRMRTHMGALSRYYLDALAGMIAVRAHGAERSVRYEHRGLLAEWTQTVGSLYGTMVLVEGGQLLLGFGFALWLLFRHWQYGSGGDLALLIYWVLSLPLLAQEIAYSLRQYPGLRSVLLRLLEPLGAPEEDTGDLTRQRHPPAGTSHQQAPNISSNSQPSRGGVQIAWEGVSVLAAGHPILTDITCTIAPGAHIAIVGPSGAGKSSLVGTLLGWHRPAAGRLLVDGQPPTGTRLAALRRATAWVDPGVHLWNRSVQENLVYGADGRPQRSLVQVIDQAELVSVLRKLPDGVETIVGEGGGLLSGGEGQRVRLARAMLPLDVRLVILDEPFRGLARTTRQRLLRRARSLWPAATLLYITHDIAETQAFARVLVMEHGRLVEDGAPADLQAQPDSRYRTMLEAETAIWMDLWGSNRWRRLRLANGVLTESRGLSLEVIDGALEKK